MEIVLLILGITLTIVLSIGLRSMKEEHLYAISTRFEAGVWFIFTLSIAGHLFNRYLDSIEIPTIFQMVFLGLMISRILTNASFILGNPPKVKIELSEKHTYWNMNVARAIERRRHPKNLQSKEVQHAQPN